MGNGGRMAEKLLLSIHDVAVATAVLGIGITVIGLLVAGFAGIPGFVWACLSGLTAAALEHSTRIQHGENSKDILGKLSCRYVGGAAAAAGASFVLPAVVSATFFAGHPWLVWIDGVLLLGGLMAVPLAHASLAVAAAIARFASPPRSGGRR